MEYNSGEDHTQPSKCPSQWSSMDLIHPAMCDKTYSVASQESSSEPGCLGILLSVI
jgi:hypothetical protein